MTTDLYLSVVSVGDVERGIARQRRRNGAFARTLAVWLDNVLAHYGVRVLAPSREDLRAQRRGLRHFRP